jgi:hypothetical protein
MVARSPCWALHYNGGRGDTDSLQVVSTPGNDLAELTTDQIVFNDAAITVARTEEFSVHTGAVRTTSSSGAPGTKQVSP